jgi:AcrR family transcriptional regulator
MQKKRVTSQPYHHGHLRDALIKSALKLISKKGVKGLTLREIAKQAKVSHTAPYRHFRDKDDLLTAVAVEGFEMLVRETHKRFLEIEDHPLIRFRESGVSYIDFAISHPSHFRVMFGLGDKRKEAPVELKRASDASFKILLDAIRECQEKKHVKSGDPMELALSAWSIVHGYAMIALEGYLSKWDVTEEKRLKEMVTDMLYFGLHL